MPGFRTAVAADRDVDILVRGPVTTQDITGVSAALAGTLRSAPEAGHVRVKLAEYRGGDREAFAVAQVNVEIDGRLVRAQSTARAVPAAVDGVVAALAPRIRRLRRRLSGSEPGPPSFVDERWDRRPARASAPAVQGSGRARQITRHKAYPLAVHDVGAAAFTMDLRDYDFHLYVDEASGQDTVVVRAGAAGFRLVAVRPELLPAGSGGVPLQGPPSRLPTLTLPEAIRALDGMRPAFLAFAGVGSGRATVLYRRFDGTLGLLRSLW
ncbi:HPF/RaiA family ribosome-associated protein [Amorphoplanes nipponensis]|uniref:Sigma 54 modulation/S30EA ribosomal protein C-terminal domain-containing protein n=1 Tax=Actinoplanes nipponensis TaxID=135950 RepID=A0A919JW69_9ACTN|nr:sigma 54 modulation/S30EA ribosomal C-terminal domain-containing protein [Actinoplanes nipponensis]GIE54114.1 hypothetical protein Ani05nite_76480 [Actinoplanes nipponensis]